MLINNEVSASGPVISTSKPTNIHVVFSRISSMYGRELCIIYLAKLLFWALVQVPDNVPPASYYLLMASGTGGYSFSTSEVVSVRRKTLSLFVQTDKIMYKPGQTGKTPRFIYLSNHPTV